MPRIPRKPLHPSSGTGQFIETAKKAIRCVRYGCTNRPFYHIVVMHSKEKQRKPPIEQVGSYDPMPNFNNERLVAFNYERIQHWIGMGAEISKPVAILLGLAGYLPIHPRSYCLAWTARKQAQQKLLEETSADSKKEVKAS